MEILRNKQEEVRGCGVASVRGGAQVSDATRMESNWCPKEDSNLHSLARTAT